MKSTCILMMAACCLAVTVFAGAAEMTPALPAAFLPQAEFAFGEVLEGTPVVHDFILQNRGEAPLHIRRVRTA